VVSIVGEDRSSEIQAGDYLEVFGGGQPRRIAGVSYNAALGQTDLAITPPLTAPIPVGAGPGPWRDYRIIRAPRITGHEPTLLPTGLVITRNTHRLQPPPRPPAVPPPNLPYGFANLNPLPPGDIDIMFAPDGRVISPVLANDFIALWVRDTTADDPAVGTPQI